MVGKKGSFSVGQTDGELQQALTADGQEFQYYLTPFQLFGQVMATGKEADGFGTELYTVNNDGTVELFLDIIAGEASSFVGYFSYSGTAGGVEYVVAKRLGDNGYEEIYITENGHFWPTF
ncbi:hypothetical protein N9O61_01425 [Octadecabacter sp.]|nr:hypothetical protein [Octadecabacter sp.]